MTSRRPPRTDIPWVRSDYHDCPDKRSPKKSMRVRADGYGKCFRCGWKGWLEGPRKPTERQVRREMHRQRGQQSYIERVVAESQPITETCAVYRYLQNRFLAQPVADFPPDLRYHPKLRHGPSKSDWLAMIGLVRAPGNLTDDHPVIGIHRTYLTQDGRKAPVDPVKMTFGDIKGNCVFLYGSLARREDGSIDWSQPSEETVIICEGIEDGLALRIEFPQHDVMVALSASNLALQEPPPINAEKIALGSKYKRVIVAPDNDPVGIAAAERLVIALEDDGRYGFSWDVQVYTPDPGVKDFAEEIARRNG